MEQTSGSASLDSLRARAQAGDEGAREIFGDLMVSRPDVVLSAPDPQEATAMLGRYMSWLSEKYWCAGWLRGLEFDVWEALHNSEHQVGFSPLAPEELATLRWLSELCGGWVRWSGEQHEPIFVAIADWQKLVAEKCGARTSACRVETRLDALAVDYTS